MNDKKRNLGQYFTKESTWLKPQVERFINKVNPKIILDPFAGAGDLLNTVKKLGFTQTKGYDIDDSLGWEFNNSIENIDKLNDGLILTNPPYLAKNSAKRRGLTSYKYFENNRFQDLYQVALSKALYACRFSVFIIPETFLISSIFKECLESITVLEDNPFIDTDCPVCICCFDADRAQFTNKGSNIYDIYKDDLFLFDSYEAEYRLRRYKPESKFYIKFNDIEGNLGLRGVDGVSSKNRIRFCRPEDLNYDVSSIKISSRAITTIKIEIDINDYFLNNINLLLEDYRAKTHDVFMAPFKNNNKEGKRRRRLDFTLARNFINKTIEDLDK